MFCKQCGQQLVDEAVVCPHCGVATGHFPQVVAQGKSRTSYILFGALLGLIGLPGIHNFYAGYNQKGLVQILVSVLSCCRAGCCGFPCTSGPSWRSAR